MWKSLVLLAALGGGDETVLLDFTASWCGPCRQMAPVVERLVSEGYPVRKVDIDQEGNLAAKYGVRQVPCFVLVSGGKEISRLHGPVSHARLVRMFEEVRGASAAAAGPERAGAAPIARGQSPDAPLAGSPPPDPFRGRASASASGSREQLSAPTVGGGAADPARKRAIDATVLITVEEPSGKSHGTGTIIDVRNGEALVLTCGHLFRNLPAGTRILVRPCTSPNAEPRQAALLEFDAEQRDIGLVSFRLQGWRVAAAQVAPAGYLIQAGMPVFSIGCDRGGPGRMAESKVTGVNRYLGAPNIEAAGQPVEGRSGGGLFSSEGLLVGVCNAADREGDEGIYAALATVHWQLDQVGLRQVYARAGSNFPAVAESESSEPGPRRLENDFAVAAEENLTAVAESEQATTDLASQPLQAVGDDAEVICIVRSRTRPQDRPNVIILDRATPELLKHLRQVQGEHGATAPLSAAAAAIQPRSQPVYRGQSQQ